MPLTTTRRNLIFSATTAFAATAAQQQQQQPSQQQHPQYTFGTTVVSTTGLQGRIHLLKRNAERLPARFDPGKKPAGVIYTTSLNVWPQRFDEGFPGVTDRHEWFAIDYTGRFWVEEPGTYRFSLLSDDGSRLEIDGERLIDLDGQHPPYGASASAYLTRGAHSIHVPYFQGPADVVALVLAAAKPGGGGAWRIFNTDEFLPPEDPGLWVDGAIRDIRRVGHAHVNGGGGE